MTGSKAAINDPLINASKEFFENPYPELGALRESAPIFWSEKGQYWLITKYSYAHDVLADLQFEKGARRFKTLDMLAKIIPNSKSILSRRNDHMLNSNPPDHTRLRSLVNKAFTPKMINELMPRIEEITNELLDTVQANGKMDLMADFAFPLPAIVIAEMLGIPPADRDRFKTWSHNITAILDPSPDPNVFNLAKIMQSYQQLEAFLRPLIEDRRKKRQNDLISALVDAEEEGNRLTESELLSNIVLLLIAGHETTTNLIGNGTLALLQHPDQMAKLKNQPELVASAISEALRYDSPVQLVRRIAAKDCEIGGHEIKEDQGILVSIGAINRDPDQFPDPNTFNIERTPNKHLAFGYGIHHCLGSSLAEAEGRIALTGLLKRMPNLRLATAKLEHKHPFALRGVKELPVTF